MKEEFLHYIWKYQLFEKLNLKTTDGEEIYIEKSGFHNTDSGPDFFNAKVKIAETTWVGNVEIHVYSSSWYEHSHHLDKAYDNVILHVVFQDDKPAKRTNGNLIPSVELKGLFKEEIFDKYKQLMQSNEWVSCQSELMAIDDLTWETTLQRMLVNRLERKVSEIQLHFSNLKSSWEETAYYALASSFGFQLNSDPFILLAKSIPLKLLRLHQQSLFQIQALLFGQAGFLTSNLSDPFFLKLQKEYQHLKNKFELSPLEFHLWKYSRLRPANFPSLRIAQFAAFIHKNKFLIDQIISQTDLQGLKSMFVFSTDNYWQYHYTFGKKTPLRLKSFGLKSIESVLINAIIPLIFFYGKNKNEEYFKELALDLINDIDAEQNIIIGNWKKVGKIAKSALDSQALIELKNNYCNEKKCLNCFIGMNILKNKHDD